MKVTFQVAATSAIVFCLSFYFRFLALSQTTFANGWDGYFYINQIRAFFEEGKMHVADVSLIYPLFALTHFFIDDYVIAYKVVVSIIAAGFSVSLFMLTTKWSTKKSTALVVAAFTIFSPHLTYFAAQYPKNLLGAVFLIWLLSSLSAEKRWLPMVLLLLNFFGHRLTAVLSLAVFIMHYFFRKISWKLVIIPMVFVIIIFSVAYILPGVLNIFDLERIIGLFLLKPQFAPISFISTFGDSLVSVLWKSEIIFLAVIFVGSVILNVRQRHNLDPQFFSMTLVLLILIFPFFHWTLDGPAFRFVQMFLLLCPVLMIFVLDILFDMNSFTEKYVPYVLVTLCLCCASTSYRSYRPEKHDPPYAVYQKIGEVITKSESPSYDLIIAHKSLAEFIVYSAHVEAMSWLPEYKVDKESMWRVAYGVRDIQFSFYLDSADLKLIKRITPSYNLIREDVWQKFMSRLRKDGDTALMNELSDWKNPHEKRPRYLMHRRQ